MRTDAAAKALRVLRQEIAKTADPHRLHQFVIEVNELLTLIENQVANRSGAAPLTK